MRFEVLTDAGDGDCHLLERDTPQFERQLQTYRRNILLPGSCTFTTRQQGLPITMASRPKYRNLHRLKMAYYCYTDRLHAVQGTDSRTVIHRHVPCYFGTNHLLIHLFPVICNNTAAFSSPSFSDISTDLMLTAMNPSRSSFKYFTRNVAVQVLKILATNSQLNREKMKHFSNYIPTVI